MRIFYSELVANPAYYSFGYSVYGQLEATDNLSDCYEQGFLPFVGARNQEDSVMYMTRGSRVLVEEFKEHHYHGRVLRKVAEVAPDGVEVVAHRKEDFTITDEFVDFILSYFKSRFGKDSMPKDRLMALLASPLLTNIVEYRIKGKPVAYMLEVHGENFLHVWYQAYAKEYTHSHLGSYLFIDMLRRAKQEQKKYVYLGVTYGTWMAYKTNFQPLEYWNGQKWVSDPKSSRLKKLLVMDPMRILAFTDQWREERDPYYKAPYPFASTFAELRFATLIMEAMPRLFLMCIASLLLVIAIIYFGIIH